MKKLFSKLIKAEGNPFIALACTAVIFVAETSISTCCWWLLNQPKVPEDLRK